MSLLSLVSLAVHILVSGTSLAFHHVILRLMGSLVSLISLVSFVSLAVYHDRSIFDVWVKVPICLHSKKNFGV